MINYKTAAKVTAIYFDDNLVSE